MSVSRSLTFLGTPWSVALSIVAVAGHGRLLLYRLAAQRLSHVDGDCSSCLRLALVAFVAILLNQPEWIEEFRPEEKPAIAVLWDASASMDTRDVVQGGDAACRPLRSRGARRSLR